MRLPDGEVTFYKFTDGSPGTIRFGLRRHPAEIECAYWSNEGWVDDAEVAGYLKFEPWEIERIGLDEAQVRTGGHATDDTVAVRRSATGVVEAFGTP